MSSDFHMVCTRHGEPLMLTSPISLFPNISLWDFLSLCLWLWLRSASGLWCGEKRRTHPSLPTFAWHRCLRRISGQPGTSPYALWFTGCTKMPFHFAPGRLSDCLIPRTQALWEPRVLKLFLYLECVAINNSGWQIIWLSTRLGIRLSHNKCLCINNRNIATLFYLYSWCVILM